MQLQLKLQQKLAFCDFSDIAQFMGYNSKNCHKATARISQVLFDPQLNLYANAYDFKFSNRQFVEQLCAALGINIKDFGEEIEQIEHAHNQQQQAFKSYIFIDTQFKRRNEPIFSLALMEKYRQLILPMDIYLLPISQQISHVQILVKKHYQDHEGTLPLWGDIGRYVFFYGENSWVSLNSQGQLLADNPNVIMSKTKMPMVHLTN